MDRLYVRRVVVFVVIVTFLMILWSFHKTQYVSNTNHLRLPAAVLPLRADDSDDYIRNCVTGNIIGKMPLHVETAPLKLLKWEVVESSPDRQQSFKKVFDSKAWGNNWDAEYKDLTASGPGSTLHWAQETVAALHAIIDQLKRRHGLKRVRLFDVPCGDMAWMSRFLDTRNDVDYTGVDIVPDLIQHHQKAFADRPWKFAVSDVVRDGLNASAGGIDLVLSRMMLQHLYFPDVRRVLGHLSRFGSLSDHPVYLLTTTFATHPVNAELANLPGRFRRLNLEIPPISLSPPLCFMRDGPLRDANGWAHFVGLWRLPLQSLPDCQQSAAVTVDEIPHKLYSCVNWSLSTR